MEMTESILGRLSIGEDVNKKQNRIPLESELATLRVLMAQNTRMSVTLENELRSAKAALGRIKEQERRLLIELESTRSEMQFSMRFVDILESQYGTLQVDLLRLKRLAHPIRRCPPDILIVIFKCLTVMEDADWCQTGITISHVCRQWRNVALDSPSLWGNIHIPRTNSMPRIEAFFKEMAYRLRSFAPDIGLRVHERDEEPGYAAAASLSSMLKSSNLNQLAHIDRLSLTIPRKSIPHLVGLNLNCQVPIKLIQLFGTTYSGRPNHATTLDLTLFLLQFPAVNEVEINRVHEINIDGTEIFDCITSLDFYDVTTIHSFSKPKRFSNLTVLDLGSAMLRGDSINHDIVLHKLQSLSMKEYDSVPWGRLDTPQLRCLLMLGNGIVTDDALSFLQRCKALRHLSLPLSREKFPSLALVVQKVEILELSIYYQGLYDWKLMDMTSHPFPYLRSFTLVAEKGLDLSELEKLVAARCHPPAQAENPLSLLPLERLAVRYDPDVKPFVEVDFKEYPFLRRSVLTYQQTPSYWSDEWQECNFTWPTNASGSLHNDD